MDAFGVCGGGLRSAERGVRSAVEQRGAERSNAAREPGWCLWLQARREHDLSTIWLKRGFGLGQHSASSLAGGFWLGSAEPGGWELTPSECHNDHSMQADLVGSEPRRLAPFRDVSSACEDRSSRVRRLLAGQSQLENEMTEFRSSPATATIAIGGSSVPCAERARANGADGVGQATSPVVSYAKLVHQLTP